MKSIKLLLLSMMVAVPAVAIDLKQSDVLVNESMQTAKKALIDVIGKCHKNDGKHNLRMDVLRDSTAHLSVIQNKHILDQYAEAALLKCFWSDCSDCKEINLFIHGGIYTLSKAIEAGKGDMTAMALAIEHAKRSEK